MVNMLICSPNVPGWTDYVSDMHCAARQAFLDWVAVGKPRSDMLYQHMYTNRAAFKQALRYCKRQKEQMQADVCARICANNDSKQFWKNVSKIANKKVTSHVNKIGDNVGETEICNMWQGYFYKLYNSKRETCFSEDPPIGIFVLLWYIYICVFFYFTAFIDLIVLRFMDSFV